MLAYSKYNTVLGSSGDKPSQKGTTLSPQISISVVKCEANDDMRRDVPQNFVMAVKAKIKTR